MEPYIYNPITKSGDIRLIELQPSLDKAAPIQCGLIHTSLTAIQDEVIDHYTALSYVWGSPTDRVTISVDGKSLQITRSLESALVHFRDATRVFNVWADGICIDQENDEEKSIQVQQMGEVYKTAAHTIIFLGESTKLSDLWLNTVIKSPMDSNFEKTSNLLPTNDAVGHKANSDLTEMLNQAMDHVLSRPWFYRVWIYQELVLSRDPRIQCGALRCTWDRFYGMAKLVGKDMTSEEPGTMVSMADRKSRKSLDVLESMHKGRTQYLANALPVEIVNTVRIGIPPTPSHNSNFRVEDKMNDHPIKQLLQMITSRRGFGVFDARDMIYAHLGLIRVGGTEINSQASMKPDYTLSVATIYADFAKAEMERSKSYDLLLLLEARNINGRMPNLKSWAPDWTMGNTLDNSIFHIAESFVDIDHSDRTENDRAKIWATSHLWTQDSDLLCSLGYVCYHVTALSHIMPNVDEHRGNGGQTKKSLQLKQHKSNSMPRPWAESLRASQTVLLQQQELRWQPTTDMLRHAGVPLGAHIVANELLAVALNGRHEASKSLIGRRIANLRPMRGETRLSLVPATTQVGDRVCYLEGYVHPVVVRKITPASKDATHQVQREAASRGIFQLGVEMETRHFRIKGLCFIERIPKDEAEIRDMKPLERMQLLVFH